MFVALARYADVALAEEEVGQPERGEFRDAQSARIEHFEHGAVAASLGRAHVDGGDDAVDLVCGEHVGQMASEFGRVDEFGGRRGDGVGQQQVVEEAPDAAQDAGLRGFLLAAVVEPADVTFDHDGFDPARSDVVEAQDEVRELSEVAHVRLDGVVGQPFFQLDVGAVAAGDFLPLFRVFCHKSLTLHRQS